MRLLHTWELTDTERHAIRSLMDSAFDGDFDDDDFDHALGGVHAIVSDAGEPGRVVGHASVVARQMLIGDAPKRCGYVEAVAVDSGWRRQGIGGEVMSRMERIIERAYDFGALGASDDGRSLYLSHGWVPWRGPLAVLAPDGRRTTGDERGNVLVYGSGLDLDAPLACDWRSGDVW